jgi:hypothetical protein
VAAVRVRGGRVLRSRSLRGILGVPVVASDGTPGGLSSDGRTLVLGPAVTSRPSRFAVLRAGTLAVRRIVRLPGMFAFDALSPDGRTMYLVEHLSLRHVRYRVRAYDVAAGRLLEQPVVDKSEPGPMRGTAASRVTSADGRWAYTLYRKRGGAFVHALDTVRRLAACVDLPRPGMRLALRGRRLLVSRTDGSRVAAVDTRTLKLVS